MPADLRFAIYLSHSWRPNDVNLNLHVWDEICTACELLVDAPDEAGANPPYYINRIEELLRRSDLFVCILTHRLESDRIVDGPDSALRCSMYAAFEIRLAERFNIPRLILYERSTGFKAPRSPRPDEFYVAFDRGKGEPLPEERQWKGTIVPRIRQWMEWAREHRRPASYEQPTLALTLIAPEIPDAPVIAELIESAAKKGGYERVSSKSPFQNNIEALQLLRAAGLVVGEFGATNPVASELYTMAHAFGLPAIRMVRGPLDATPQLPFFLRDHPGGYRQDLVRWNRPEDLPPLIEPRLSAMFRISRSLRDDDTRHYLNSKRYSHFFVFISHTLKPPHRTLVEEIYRRLGEKHVKPFEYHLVNTSGDDWKKALDEQLQKTTHFVLLLTDGYETSQVCTYEIEEILKRGPNVRILPFLVQGRSVPHPKVSHLHHRLLSPPDPAENAAMVADQVMQALI